MVAVEFIDRNGFALEIERENLFDELYKLAIDTAASQVNEQHIATFFEKIMVKKTL